MSLTLSLCLAGAVTSASLACGQDTADVRSGPAVVGASYEKHADIVDTAVGAGKFKTLAAALTAAGLVDTLKSEGPFTVFAPTDDAFAALPAGTVETLLKPENKDQLIAILTYHVVPGRVLAEDVVKLNSATTVNGQRVGISTKDGVTVDGARVVKTDIACSNGVIHVIDKVMIPESRTIPEIGMSNSDFQTLVAAVQAAGLVETLSGPGPFTLFAPTNEAFAALPPGTVESLLKPENRSELARILTYHVVPGRVYSDQALKLDMATTVEGSSAPIERRGDALFIDGARVTSTDIQASNGVIHVIDKVMIPE